MEHRSNVPDVRSSSRAAYTCREHHECETLERGGGGERERERCLVAILVAEVETDGVASDGRGGADRLDAHGVGALASDGRAEHGLHSIVQNQVFFPPKIPQLNQLSTLGSETGSSFTFLHLPLLGIVGKREKGEVERVPVTAATAEAEVLLVAQRAWEESSSDQRQLYSERNKALSLLLIVDLHRRSIGAQTSIV